MAVKVRALWTGKGLQFSASGWSSHEVVMDAAERVGGTDTGPRPMELILLGLVGCTGMDVVSLLKKMRVGSFGLELTVRAEKAPEHPRTYTNIDMEYVITGPHIDQAKVKRAIELSQDKYCSVSAMLRKHCPVEYRYRVVEAQMPGPDS